MGDRGQIHIIGYGYKDDEKSHIWLYTHWGCYDLINDLRKAMIKARGEPRKWGGYTGRWKDDEYLPRIIFQGMLDGDDGLTGYGIYGGPGGQHGDVYRIIEVDIENQHIKVITDSEYIEGDKVRFSGTFEEFIATEHDSIQWYDPEDD